MMKNVCIAALGANAVLFGLGTLWGMQGMMWLALGSSLLCVLGIKLNNIEDK